LFKDSRAAERDIVNVTTGAARLFFMGAKGGDHEKKIKR
jgi:hypothetical protein